MDAQQHMAVFAGRVRGLRRRQGFTQKVLAEQAGISTEHLNKIERAAAAPSFAVICSLAGALGVEPAVLFAGFDDGSAAGDRERLEERLSRCSADVRRLEKQCGRRGDRIAVLEKELDETGRVHRILTEEAEDVIWMSDTDFTLTYASPSVSKLLGYAPEEAVGRNLREFVAPGSRRLFERAAAKRALYENRGEKDRPLRMEFEHAAADGSTFWAESISRPLRDENGRIKAFIGYSRVMGERRKEEMRLREGGDFLNAIINAVPDLLMVKDREHRWVLVNDAFCALTGRSRSELEGGRSDRLVFPGTRAAELWKRDETVFETGEPVAEERVMTGVDGVTRVFFFISNRYENSRGEVFLAAVGRDISAHKKTERRLREAERAASILYRVSNAVGSAGEMQALYGAVHDMLRGALPAANFYVALVNKEEDRLDFVYFTNEIDARYAPLEGLERRLRASGGSEAEPPSVLEEVLRTGRSLRVTRQVMALTGMSCPGSPPKAWLGAPIRVRREILGVMAVSCYDDPEAYSQKDADFLQTVADQLALGLERERAAKALRRAKEEADQANKAKSEFLAGMSHEIRTPMNAVLGMTTLALDADRDEVRREYLETAAEAARHLLHVIDDILDFSRIEARRVDLRPANFNIRSVLSLSVRMLAVEARQKGLELKLDIGSDVPETLYGDAGRLSQIIINLAGNAVKFTERGGVDVGAESCPLEPDDAAGAVRILFRISDTGIGVPYDKLEAIFGGFSRADEAVAGSYEGAGLGLSISRRLARLMGGDVKVRSEPGRGSEFSFSAVFGAAEEAAASEPVEPSGEIASPRPIHVLLCDDNPVNVKVAGLHLDRLGCRVDVAENGKRALARLLEKRYDLVLMDLEMPVMDGLTAARIIRGGEYKGRRILNPDVPMAALTAHVSREIREKCAEAGMGSFVAKPFHFKELDAVVMQAAETGPSSADVAAPRAPGAASGAQLDREGAKRLLGIGDEDFELLLRISLKELEKRLEACGTALKDGDMERLLLHAHTMKSSAAAIGAERCAEAAAGLEKAAAARDAEEAGRRLDDLSRETAGLNCLFE